jgi:hypothetical protein
MAGKTKKRGTKKGSTKKRQTKSSVLTIPELRKAFEHVETFVELHCKKPKAVLVKLFKEEWKKTFKKQIDTKEAEAYIENELQAIHHKKPHQRKHSGGAMALQGAPILSETRPGLYISPGVNQGSYAQVPAYVDKGFWNPEIGRQYDPVPGQTHYPDATPYGMGSNKALVGGTRRKKKNQQKGGDVLGAIGQFFMRPVFTQSPPPNVFDNTTTKLMAIDNKQLGPSPAENNINSRYLSDLNGINPPQFKTTVTTLPTTSDTPKAWYTS